MTDKPKIIVKQDKEGRWRGGDGRFVPQVVKPPKPVSGKVKG